MFNFLFDLLKMIIFGFWVAILEWKEDDWGSLKRVKKAQEAIQSFQCVEGATCIVTGANNGIGLETACQLASLGYHVILGCRSKQRAEEAIEKIIKKNSALNKPHQLEFIELDLNSFDSIRRFADQVIKKDYKVNLLINNAGVMFVPRALTTDNVEQHFGCNYLGHFLLTRLLLNVLRKNSPSRVINLTSSTYIFGKLNLDDYNYSINYSRFEGYARAKQAIIISTVEFVRRLENSKKYKDITFVSVHPGAAKTDIGREFPQFIKFLWNLTQKAFSKVLIPVEQGSCVTIWAALSPDVQNMSGKYIVNCAPAAIADKCKDPSLAQKLWDLSERLTGLDALQIE